MASTGSKDPVLKYRIVKVSHDCYDFVMEPQVINVSIEKILKNLPMSGTKT